MRFFILLEGDILARMTDEAYMQRALELALQAEGNTSPNPMVGCVIVDAEGNIVGEGYHHKAGEPHAEVNALAEAKQMAQGATAYVTLEPCAHYGRTGPCCVALARAGIGKVVVACLDPNPKVAGQGLEYLRLQGIEVVTGVCEKEAQRLNERFFTWITKQRPFITLKYAMTLDGKIATATGDSKWITGEEARTFAHRLRKQHDAVLVGIGTVLEDDPELTTRLVRGKNPVRVVLDSSLKISLMAAVLNPHKGAHSVSKACIKESTVNCTAAFYQQAGNTALGQSLYYLRHRQHAVSQRQTYHLYVRQSSQRFRLNDI